MSSLKLLLIAPSASFNGEDSLPVTPTSGVLDAQLSFGIEDRGDDAEAASPAPVCTPPFRLS